MAAKKTIEQVPEAELFETEAPFEAPEEDVIVLKKSLVVNVGVAVLFFIIGAAAAYFLFVVPKNLQIAALTAAQQQAGTGQIQPQPTEPPARIEGVGVGKLPPYGPANAPIKIVEFSDFQCPYCKQWTDTTLEPLREKYGDQIVIYYRHYPLTSIHPEAMDGAVAAECANEQGKFWEMHDSLFQTQSVISVDNSEGLASTLGLDAEKFSKCMAENPYSDSIAADMADAATYGVTGTPTFFINGVRLVGALPLAQFTAVIDQELNK
jgi:protein-disulfide isomerase